MKKFVIFYEILQNSLSLYIISKKNEENIFETEKGGNVIVNRDYH